jgi:hypothetical protein
MWALNIECPHGHWFLLSVGHLQSLGASCTQLPSNVLHSNRENPGALLKQTWQDHRIVHLKKTTVTRVETVPASCYAGNFGLMQTGWTNGWGEYQVLWRLGQWAYFCWESPHLYELFLLPWFRQQRGWGYFCRFCVPVSADLLGMYPLILAWVCRGAYLLGQQN